MEFGSTVLRVSPIAVNVVFSDAAANSVIKAGGAGRATPVRPPPEELPAPTEPPGQRGVYANLGCCPPGVTRQWQAPTMAFKLTYSDGQEDDYDDSTQWEVEGGVLKMGQEPGKWTVLVSPSHWATIEMGPTQDQDRDKDKDKDNDKDNDNHNDNHNDKDS